MSEDISELIRILAGTNDSDTVILVDAEVVSVDTDKRNCKCTIITGKAQNEITVRLMSAVGDGILIKPSVESTVSVLMSKKVDPIIFQYSDIDEIIILGGDLHGLIKIEDLVKKLNNVEKALNTHITKFNTHTHTGVQSGGSSTAVPAATDTQHLTETTQQDLENKNISHG